MRSAILRRTASSVYGTFGEIISDKGLRLKTGELQKKHNEPEISCILAGRYRCVWAESPSKGWCYHLQGVPGRTNILIHAMNWVGDRTKGLKCDALGCIGVGRAIGQVEGQMGLKDSRTALKEFEGHMDHQDFWLTIEDRLTPVG